MQTAQHTSTALHNRVTATIITGAALWLLLTTAVFSAAQQDGEKTFASPGDAVLALYNAAKSDNPQAAGAAIFGSNAKDMLNSGDSVADKNTVNQFVTQYTVMHRVVLEPNGTATLYIGPVNWPFPVPIVKNASGAWYFDTVAGKKEILYRRVGRNENDAINILYRLVEAQLDYFSEIHDGDQMAHYAMKFISDEGKQNGLYWKTGDNDPPSPIGPALVMAAAEGYTIKQDQQQPFHGYYFRILTKQGPAAKGGSKDYVVNGQMTKGFAFVAYPAQYRNSGVMTFMVDQDDVVYEKDLGPDTTKAAAAMTEYNPDKTWSRVD